MKKLLSIYRLISAFPIFMLFACSSQHEKSTETIQEKKIEYAKNFNLVEKENYTLLQLIDPENEKVELEYALLKKENFNTPISSNIIKVEIPIRNVAALSGTHIGMLDKIKSVDVIRAVSSKNYIYNPQVLKKINNASVHEMNDFGQMNPETIFNTGVKIIIYSGFGKTPEYEEKLSKLGIICMPNYDWREKHPLGKAEWIKVFGALCDKKDEAASYFDNLVKEYENLVESAKTYSSKPSVFSGSMIGDTWYMPAAGSYGATLFNDAHANYIETEISRTGSTALSFEEVLRRHKNTDFWFNPGLSTENDMLVQFKKYALFGSFQNGNVFCYSHNSNKFWELSAIEPHHVLKDYIHFLHDTENKTYKPYFYKKIQ
jgi:iron complex transport system substrate-binding protein